MKIKLYIFCLSLILACGLINAVNAQKKRSGNAGGGSASASLVKNEKEELEAAIALPPAGRIEKLKAFVEAHPRSALKTRALELIVSAHASLGEEKLAAGDAAGGTEQFRLAVAGIPNTMSDKLFGEVVSQIPTNLFLRGERAASLELARLIEERVRENPKRLLMVAAFYLGIEATDDVMRVADAAIKLAPEASAAYQARGAAHRMALRLEASVADYERAVELEPKSESARKSLADLRRATGKTEEALALYKERVSVDPKDEFARTGMVVSLFELGKKEEAERELEAALKEMPNSLALLTGMAYWFAAHNESERAVELAQKAIAFEPRYTWSHVALSRGLLAQQRPLDAERTLLTARQYGRFPTLDYELASVLAAAGLYGEAAAALSSFRMQGDQLETYLAGRTLARAGSFTELLAPERRASIFQFTAADNETSARMLKSLVAFNVALNPVGGRAAIKEADVLAAAQEFIGGEDAMRAFRRLYVANRLLEARVAYAKVLELTEAVTAEVEKALDVPTATVAVMAEEIRDARASANLRGSSLNVPTVPRNTLSSILRGHIEDLAGLALLNQDKFPEALVRFRRAMSVIPENSVWWRNSLWHIGSTLDASGKPQEALDSYIKSYRGASPNITRRAVIESLYRKTNGSLDGLEEKIGPSPFVASNTTPAPPSSADTPASTSSASAETGKPVETKAEETKAEETQPVETKPVETKPEETKTIETKPVETRPEEAKPIEIKPAAAAPPETQQPAPVESNTEKAVATPPPVEVAPGPPPPAENDEPPAGQTDTPQADESAPPAPAPDSTASRQQRQRRVVESSGCTISVSENFLAIQNNSGSAIITLTLEGVTNTDGVTASTSDWSALAVFPEPKSSTTASNTLSFSVTSISKKTGTFTITFKTPCGTKDVTVSVK
ncbi:MAG: tetratricopeptide repeat protein [Pyrinomonadaceae bacterium]|nr:tetratricopeptide repeat protein [Pyrinomonadaceae bacterium]